MHKGVAGQTAGRQGRRKEATLDQINTETLKVETRRLLTNFGYRYEVIWGDNEYPCNYGRRVFQKVWKTKTTADKHRRAFQADLREGLVRPGRFRD